MTGRGIYLALESEIRDDPALLDVIREMTVIYRDAPHAKERASDIFVLTFVYREREGRKLYDFFETFKQRHELNQQQCPKRYLLQVIRDIMCEVEQHAGKRY